MLTKVLIVVYNKFINQNVILGSKLIEYVIYKYKKLELVVRKENKDTVEFYRKKVFK